MTSDRSEMVHKVFRKTAAVQVGFSTAGSITMIADNIVISRFLGVEAVGALGIIAPLLMLLMAVSQVLSTGGQVKCSEQVGRGDVEKASAIMSLTVMCGVVFSLLTLILAVVIRHPVVSLLGAAGGTALHDLSIQYLLGFVIGVPGFMCMFLMFPFVMLEGDKKRIIRATAVMAIADIAGDILAVTVFNAGVFGVGLASSIGYYLAAFIMLLHFLQKKGTLTLRLRNLPIRLIGGILRSGLPAALQKVLLTLLGIILNHIILHYEGTVALGIYTVICNILNLFNSAGQGMGGTTLLLTGVFFSEEDRHYLKDVVKAFVRDGLLINLALLLLVAAAAKPLIMVFSRNGEIDLSLASTALRFAVLDFIVFAMVNCFKTYYQGTHKRGLTYAITVAQSFVFPILAAFPLIIHFGINGICSAAAAGDALTLLMLYIVLVVKNRSPEVSIDKAMLLEGDPRFEEEAYLRRAVRSENEAADAAREVEDFISAHRREGSRRDLPLRMGLCVEELCKNTIEHGFAPHARNAVEVSVSAKKDRFVLRIRDDSGKFDPVAYIEQNEQDSYRVASEKFGLRIVRNAAREIRYSGALGLNSVVITEK